MDSKRADELVESSLTDNHEKSAALEKHIRGLINYAETREPYFAEFSGDNKQPETQLNELLHLLQIDHFDGSKIIYTVYDNTAGNGYEECETPNFDGQYEPDQIWGILADAQTGNVEFVNDFRAGFVLEIDEETVVALNHELEEFACICEECQTSEEAVYNHELGYSCDHELYEYRYSYWVFVLDKKDMAKIDWARGIISEK
jgi:hypothetical protein